jgi:prophage antirepressor-like protein
MDVAHQVRVVTIDGKPWFVAADVCRVLGLAPNVAGRTVRDDEKGQHQVLTLGGPQKMTIISRPGLSKLSCGATSPPQPHSRTGSPAKSS